ncbi:MAG: DUF4102 domain-containing protein [Mesorhizobium sp.]|nr:MAG: DUF4102 domain-containing protein [Mesorhizobium sp.]
MARALNKLSDTAIRVKELSPGRYGDGGGLYLHVSPTGNKSWVFLGIKDGKRMERGLGSYPKPVSLAAAREKATECRRLLKAGLDPAHVEADDAVETSGPTFAECATDLIAEVGKGWANAKHKAQWEMTLGDTYCKDIRPKRVSEVSTADILAILKPIWLNKPETAQRLRGRIERVLDAAKAAGHRTGENPAMWRGHLQHLLAKPGKLTRGHHAAMPYEQVPALVTSLRETDGLSALALEYLILTAARSGEVLGMVWPELDLDAKVWTVPAARMKAKEVHRVPLPDRAMAIVRSLYDSRTSDTGYVFPGETVAGIERGLSSMAMAMTMRRLEVGQYTVHGFRSAFRDWAGDQTSFPREVAEAALAHKVGNAVEHAYRRSDALEKRRKLMTAWANYLAAANTAKHLRVVSSR